MHTEKNLLNSCYLIWMQNILVIDQGTHATRALLFSPQGEVLDQAEQRVSLHRIDHQQVEQDAQDILDSVWQLIHQIAERQTLDANTCCALTTQRSTIVVWDKNNGKALRPALSWQDRRAQDDLKSFSHHAANIKNITGLPLSPHYGAGKLRWLLTRDAAVQAAIKQNTAFTGPLASFLLWHLLESHDHVVDFSNAHRMQLFDVRRRDWSPELINLFGLQQLTLPQCQPLIHEYGRLQHYGCELRAVCGDQTAAFHGLGPLPAGTAVVNIGTGAFILAACDHVITDTPLLCGIQANGWLLEGTVNGAGAALDWAQQHWPVQDLFGQLPHWLAAESSPPVFINTVGGLGSPWWMDGGEPRFVGNEPLSPEKRYVAVIESIVFLLQHNLQEMQKHLPIHRLYLGGGLSRLDGLCQKLANLSGCRIVRGEDFETTARGAAWLAAGQPADWFGTPMSPCFEPAPDSGLRQRYQAFTEALHKPGL
jgi:glycerol kinase